MRRWVFHIAALVSLLFLIVTCAGWAGGIYWIRDTVSLGRGSLTGGQMTGYWYAGQGEANTTAWFAANWIQLRELDRAYKFFDEVYVGAVDLPGVNVYWQPRNGEWFVIVSPWLSVLLTLPLPVLWLRSYRYKRNVRTRIAAGQCAACGYDLQGSAGDCPECGATPRV